MKQLLIALFCLLNAKAIVVVRQYLMVIKVKSSLTQY